MFLSLEIAGARDETSDVKRYLHSDSVQEIGRRTVTPLPSKRSYTGLLTGRRSLQNGSRCRCLTSSRVGGARVRFGESASFKR